MIAEGSTSLNVKGSRGLLYLRLARTRVRGNRKTVTKL
jgi:hypothetical protein